MKLDVIVLDQGIFLREHSSRTKICRRSDNISGFVTPAIGPDKSKKLTQLIIAPVHNIRCNV